MKFVSDVEVFPEDNHFLVEWEYAYGGRHWESFDSEEQLNKAVELNNRVNELDKENVLAYQLSQDVNLMELELEYDLVDCGFLMSEYEECKMDWFLAVKSNGGEFSVEDFQDVQRQLYKSLS